MPTAKLYLSLQAILYDAAWPYRRRLNRRRARGLDARVLPCADTLTRSHGRPLAVCSPLAVELDLSVDKFERLGPFRNVFLRARPMFCEQGAPLLQRDLALLHERGIEIGR